MLNLAAAHLDPESHPLGTAIRSALKPGKRISELERIGLGWRINKFGVIVSNGATGGYRAAILIHPPTDLAVIVMVNSQLGGVVGGRAGLFDQIAAALVNVVLGGRLLILNCRI